MSRVQPDLEQAGVQTTPMSPALDDAELAECVEYVRRVLAGEVIVHRVRLDLARVCNFKCRFCFSSLGEAPPATAEAQSVPLSALRELAEQFKKLEVRYVNLYGGGEPTMHPHFDEALDILVDSGVRLRIVTNGRGLLSGFSDALVRHGGSIDVLRFSVPGVSGDAYRAATGVDCFDAMTAAITDYIARAKQWGPRPEIGIYVPLMSDCDEGELRQFVAFAAASGAEWLIFRTDTRFWAAGRVSCRSDAGSLDIPGLQAKIDQAAETAPGFPVRFTHARPTPRASARCYVQLSDVALVYAPSSAKLFMVRCPHLAPEGLSDRPPDGAYKLIEPAGLYAACKAELQEALTVGPAPCPSPQHCLAWRRNRRIAEGLDGLRGHGARCQLW